jgi:DNA-binding transcriptional LysR family regulator
LVPDYPDLGLEMRIGSGPSDSDQKEYDIRVERNGNGDVAEDRVALRVAPDRRMVIVGSPAYLASQALPHEPADLLRHNCIPMQADDGTLHTWELQKGKRKLSMRVSGQCSFNGAFQMATPHLRETVSHSCQRILSKRMWSKGNCAACWRTGLLLSPDASSLRSP